MIAGELFSVASFDSEDYSQYHVRSVPLAEAKTTIEKIIQQPAVAFGFVSRVIITDRDDLTVFEWKKDHGIVFPVPEKTDTVGEV